MPKTDAPKTIKAVKAASSEFLRGEPGEAHAAPAANVATAADVPSSLGDIKGAAHPAWPPNELAAMSQAMGRVDRGESLELSDTPTYMKGTPAPT